MANDVVFSAKNRPQRLCKTCGKCCTMAVCQYTQEELQEFSLDKESEAKDFLECFEPYETLDIPNEISPEYVQIVIEKLREQGKFVEGAPIFYRCKYVGENNLCTKYEDRYGWCHRTPTHAWTLMPPDCGFRGWQFAVREQIKHNIRKLKEHLYECELLYGEGNIPAENMTVAELREIVNEKIKAFERFGSWNW